MGTSNNFWKSKTGWRQINVQNDFWFIWWRKRKQKGKQLKSFHLEENLGICIGLLLIKYVFMAGYTSFYKNKVYKKMGLKWPKSQENNNSQFQSLLFLLTINQYKI